jgi:hypothetical protein
METIEKINQFLKGIGIEVAYIVAGIFGTMARLSKDDQLTFFQILISIVAGSGVANYLTPVICDIIRASNNTRYGIAFICGYMGLKAVEIAINYIKSHKKGK